MRKKPLRMQHAQADRVDFHGNGRLCRIGQGNLLHLSFKYRHSKRPAQESGNDNNQAGIEGFRGERAGLYATP
jgi:hypothetical protein